MGRDKRFADLLLTACSVLDVEGMYNLCYLCWNGVADSCVQAENADEWSYQKGLAGGWIPKDPSDRMYPNICG